MGPDVSRNMETSKILFTSATACLLNLECYLVIIFFRELCLWWKIITKLTHCTKNLVWVKQFKILFWSYGAKEPGWRKPGQTVATVKKSLQNAINKRYISFNTSPLWTKKKLQTDQLLVQRSMWECHSCQSTNQEAVLHKCATHLHLPHVAKCGA